jgi:two-component system, sensor histidine kinase ChiS
MIKRVLSWVNLDRHPAPLRLVLVVPFVVQLFGVSLLVGWLSYANSEHTVEDLVGQLLTKTSDRVTDELELFTEIPPLVTQINFNAIRLNQLDLNDLESWGPHLFEQQQLFNALTYIYIGNEQGDYTEFRRV